MVNKLAEQNPIEGYESEEYGSDDVQIYDVPELEDESLSGVIFNLPYSPSRFSVQPILCVYAEDDMTGYFFQGKSFHEDTVAGIEGPEAAEDLESGDYRAANIDPFIGRYDDIKDGFRHYVLSANDRVSHEVTVDVRPDEEREREKVVLDSFRDGDLISRVLMGRTGNGWDFLSAKNQESSEEIR